MNAMAGGIPQATDSGRFMPLAVLLICCLAILSQASAATDITAGMEPGLLFENEIPILGIVEQNRSSAAARADLVSLKLGIRKGSGQVFVSLAAIHKIDTQIALRSAHRITCRFLDLDCRQYDFYYSYNLGSRNLVGGQSGAAAAAFLLVKTLRREVVDPSLLVIGNLAPGAIVARADGIETKIELAQSLGFSTLYIPGNTVCENTPYCDGFVLSHRGCRIDNLSAAGQTAKRQVGITCPRMRSRGQYALELPACELVGEPLSANPPMNQAMICKQSIGGRDLRLEYDHCKMICRGNGECDLQCSEPEIDGFIDVKRVIGLEQILGEAAGSAIETPVTEKLAQNMRKMAGTVCSRHSRYQIGNATDSEPKLAALRAEYTAANDRVEAAAGSHSYALLQLCSQRNVLAQTIDLGSQLASGVLTLDAFIEMVNSIGEKIAKDLARIYSATAPYDADSYLFLRARAQQMEETRHQLQAAVISLTTGSFIGAAGTYAKLTEGWLNLDIWIEQLRHEGVAAEFDLDALKSACGQLNQRIQLAVLTLERFQAARYTARVSAQTTLAEGGTDPAVCLYRGIELEAEMSAAVNFVDMENNAKKRFLDQFLSFVHSRMLTQAQRGAYPLLTFIYHDLARYSLDQGNLDDAYLLANTAVNFLYWWKEDI